MNENLVGSECYICMEVCKQKSPCQCATHVHPECLIEYLSSSGHTHCTICLGQYPVPPPPTRFSRCALNTASTFVAVALFFFFGWLGSFTIHVPYEPISGVSMIAVILSFSVLFVLYKFILESYRACRQARNRT